MDDPRPKPQPRCRNGYQRDLAPYFIPGQKLQGHS